MLKESAKKLQIALKNCKDPAAVAKDIFTNVSPALTFGYHGADRPKQNIKQRIVNFCTLPFVTGDTEMLFDF